jgi:hypothetical protein
MTIGSNAIQTYNLEGNFENGKNDIRAAKFYSASAFFVGSMEIFGSSLTKEVGYLMKMN